MTTRDNGPHLLTLPGVLAALTNVLLLIYTSTQYSGWTATEKVRMSFEKMSITARLRTLRSTKVVGEKGVLFKLFDTKLGQIVFFVFLEHIIFGAKHCSKEVEGCH